MRLPKWCYINGQLRSGPYAIDWEPRPDGSKAYMLSKRGTPLEVFPDDVGTLFAAMDAAEEDAANTVEVAA